MTCVYEKCALAALSVEASTPATHCDAVEVGEEGFCAMPRAAAAAVPATRTASSSHGASRRIPNELCPKRTTRTRRSPGVPGHLRVVPT